MTPWNQVTIVGTGLIGGSLGLRLREMGLVPGTKITVTGRAPLHDPVKLRINGQTLTLRNREADHMELTAAETGGTR